MAYDKSSSGCTPITAKIKRTTQGGVVQPLLNMGAPVKMKASSPAKNMTARQKANESRIKVKKESEAAKASAEKAKELQKAKELSSKEFVTNKRGRKVKNPKYQTQTIQPVKGASGNKTGSTKANRELKDILERKGIDVSSYKGDPRGKMKKGTYRYAKASQPKLDSIISKRNKATKGSAEYNRYQNQINKAYGVGPTNRSTTEKTTSTIKPKVTIESKKPTADVLTKAKPKAPKITNEKAAKRSERKTSRAQKTREKGIEALESGNTAKARRLYKREQRIKKRAAKQADKAIEPKKPSAAKQTAKQQQQKEKREKALAKAKFIKKAEKKGNLKELKKNPPKVKRVYK
jgi:hypothetical protein